MEFGDSGQLGLLAAQAVEEVIKPGIENVRTRQLSLVAKNVQNQTPQIRLATHKNVRLVTKKLILGFLIFLRFGFLHWKKHFKHTQIRTQFWSTPMLKHFEVLIKKLAS